MAGLNTTGLANTSDYNLGRGKLYFASLDSSDMPTAYRDLGNCTEFNLSVESEALEHQSSREGLKITDKEVLVSQKASLSLTLDEINFQNMALFFSGSTSTHASPHIAGALANEVLVPAGTAVEAGRWYDLIDVSAKSRIYDLTQTGTPLTTAGVTGVEGKIGGVVEAWVENTDYLIDGKMGRLFVLSTTVKDLTDGLHFDLAQDATAKVADEVRGLTQTSVAGALKFISENPADGDKQSEYQFHSVSLKAEGDFGLINDEFTTMQLTGVAEKKETVDTNSPTLTIRTHTDA